MLNIYIYVNIYGNKIVNTTQLYFCSFFQGMIEIISYLGRTYVHLSGPVFSKKIKNSFIHGALT